MERIFCLLIGYVFGIFQTGYIYGRLNHIDIRDYGSGNAGTTNVMRTLGKKAGFITYFGDAIKAVLCIVLIHFTFGIRNPEIEFLLVLYAGLGVILGHNFPFYLKFRGGKGIATTSGVILSLLPYNWILAVLAFATFMLGTFISKYVSLGSLLMVTGFFIEFVIFGQLGMLNVLPVHLPEAYIIAFIITALAFIRHKENIKRLLSGTERKIGQKKNQ
ncbi:MAG: glycerol-3-phosphate 1-O-acyltransferase PlsY [Clostridia bacterium]|nr:glycerol-3-phosphate 1-O-acyltransferase PlsY [Clostridia bacterium]